MKFLLLVFVIIAVAWWIGRAGRRVPPPSPGPKDAPPDGAAARARAGGDAGPAEMVACAHCGVHLPRTEALPGPGGVFCSGAHRDAGAAR